MECDRGSRADSEEIGADEWRRLDLEDRRWRRADWFAMIDLERRQIVESTEFVESRELDQHVVGVLLLEYAHSHRVRSSRIIADAPEGGARVSFFPPGSTAVEIEDGETVSTVQN